MANHYNISILGQCVQLTCELIQRDERGALKVGLIILILGAYIQQERARLDFRICLGRGERGNPGGLGSEQEDPNTYDKQSS
jgi:hypothetical protein